MGLPPKASYVPGMLIHSLTVITITLRLGFSLTDPKKKKTPSINFGWLLIM